MKVFVMCKNLELNGITKVATQYCFGLDKDKYEVYILASLPYNHKIVEDLKKNNINLLNLQKKSLNYYLELNRYIKKYKPNIIHIHCSSATSIFESIIAKIKKIKKIIIHSHNTKCSFPIFHYLMRPFLNKISTDKIACGEEAGKWMFSNDRFIIINNGIEIEKFKYNESTSKKLRDELRLKNNFVVGHIGRLNDQKNQQYLIDIFNRINDSSISLVLVGTGPNKEILKDKIKNKNIIMYGESDAPEELYNLFDIFVMPSQYEGFPVVLVEAQANGLKCIVSDRISNEVDLTNSVEFLPLDDSSLWIQHINKKRKSNEPRIFNSEKNINVLKSKGYDIKENLNKIESIYMDGE